MCHFARFCRLHCSIAICSITFWLDRDGGCSIAFYTVAIVIARSVFYSIAIAIARSIVKSDDRDSSISVLIDRVPSRSISFLLDRDRDWLMLDQFLFDRDRDSSINFLLDEFFARSRSLDQHCSIKDGQSIVIARWVFRSIAIAMATLVPQSILSSRSFSGRLRNFCLIVWHELQIFISLFFEFYEDPMWILWMFEIWFVCFYTWFLYVFCWLFLGVFGLVGWGVRGCSR